jgi:hypothetical protein
MKFCEWHRVTRMCRRTVIPHLDMRFFSQVSTFFKIDTHSGGIVSSDNDKNTFVLLIRMVLKRRDKFAVPIRASKLFSDEGTYECRSRSRKSLWRILLWDWEMSQNILGSLAYGPGVEHETYRWEMKRLLALHWQSISWRRQKFHLRSINLKPYKGTPCIIQLCRHSHYLCVRGSERN